MSSPAAVVSNGLVRVIRPQSRFRPYRSEQVEEKSRLLSKMDAFYREAYRRLPAETMLDACFCIGLLDPVSNVMANALLSSAPDAGRGPDLELVDEAKLREEMGKRSIDGLVAFLLYLFPYLAGWEALRYLLVADADLLVAARIIVADRGMMRFSVTSPASVRAFKGALLLAAQVAKHPEPECLVSVWMSLSSQLQQCLGFLSEINYQSQNQEINFLSIRRLLDCLDDLGNAWDLAVFRPSYSSSIADMPYQATRSLRMALLDTIRGFYLQALARLPRHELHTRYYRRSLLRGGYCYGPLDPVSNIIINTIWHDVMLPAAEQPVLDMIGPNSLTRLESCSFYGLASFLQTRYHNLSEHEVLQCLVASCAYLPCVDRNLDAGDDHMSVANLNLNDVAAPGGEAEWQQEQCRSRSPGIYASVRKLEQQSPCTSTQEGYEAAATATWHRDPEAQAVFLSGCKALLEGSALSLLQTGDRLTSEDLQYIASLFCTKQKPAPERIEMPHDVDEKTRSEYRQRRVSRKVKAALRQNLLQDGEPMYELHVICSANVSVCGPEYGEDKNDPLSPAPCKFWYSHVNFLAIRKGSAPSERHPILFFAEFDNEQEEGEPLLCCPVDVPTPFAEHVRCVYCEARGLKIVHPSSEKLHGGGREWDDVICGRRYLNNDRLIGKSEHAVQQIGTLGEDFILSKQCPQHLTVVTAMWPEFTYLPLTAEALQLLPAGRKHNKLRDMFPQDKLSDNCNPDKRLTAAKALKHPWFGAPHPSTAAAAAAAKVEALPLPRKKMTRFMVALAVLKAQRV